MQKNKLIAELRRPERPPSGAPYSHRSSKENKTHKLIFLMVFMASGIARGRVRTTTAAAMVESRNMAAILQIIS